MRFRLVNSHWAYMLGTEPSILQNLDLTPYNTKINDHTIRHIAAFAMGRPRSVNISNCFHLTDAGFQVLANNCSRHVKSWKMKSVWDVNGPVLVSMLLQWPDLEELDLSNCRKIGDATLARIIGWTGKDGDMLGCPSLQRVMLSYCKHITDRTMHHISVYAANSITELDLTRCTSVTDHGFQLWSLSRFPNLMKLTLADCTFLTDNSIVSLTNAAKGLQYLDLSFCCALSDTSVEVLSLGCSNLKHLNLSFCGSAVSDASLVALGLHLIDLQELSVRGCIRVTEAGVKAICQGCPSLSQFDISQCKSLEPWVKSGEVHQLTQNRRLAFHI